MFKCTICVWGMGMSFFQDFGSVYFGCSFLGLHPYGKPIFCKTYRQYMCVFVFGHLTAVCSWLAETSSTGHQHDVKLTWANVSSMKIRMSYIFKIMSFVKLPINYSIITLINLNIQSVMLIKLSVTWSPAKKSMVLETG